MRIAIIPLLGIGGMQLYRAEMSGPMKDQKIQPRIAETAKALWFVYFFLTMSCALAYWLAGRHHLMRLHIVSQPYLLAAFSTHDASIGYFNSSAINFITVIFLWISACNFALHFRAFSTLGRENILKIYTKDPEFRFFMSIQILLIVVCTLVMISHQYFDSSLAAQLLNNIRVAEGDIITIEELEAASTNPLFESLTVVNDGDIKVWLSYKTFQEVTGTVLEHGKVKILSIQIQS